MSDLIELPEGWKLSPRACPCGAMPTLPENDPRWCEWCFEHTERPPDRVREHYKSVPARSDSVSRQRPS